MSCLWARNVHGLSLTLIRDGSGTHPRGRIEARHLLWAFAPEASPFKSAVLLSQYER